MNRDYIKDWETHTPGQKMNMEVGFQLEVLEPMVKEAPEAVAVYLKGYINGIRKIQDVVLKLKDQHGSREH